MELSLHLKLPLWTVCKSQWQGFSFLGHLYTNRVLTPDQFNTPLRPRVTAASTLPKTHTYTPLHSSKKFNCSSIIFIRASKILSLHLLHYTIGNQWSVGKTWNLVTNSQETVPSHAPKLIFILCDYWLKSLGLNAPHQGVILQPTMHLSQNRWPACYKNIQLCPNWKIENFQKGNPGKSHIVKNRHAYQ